jgi:hypothetical protein
MLELLKPNVEFIPVYAARLVADIPDERLADQPLPNITMNHAAWTLGHLAWAFDNGVGMLGGPKKLDAWKATVGQGSIPVSDRSKYPPKEELLAALKDSQTRALEALLAAKPETLAAPATPERMRHIFPTQGSAIVGLFSTHQGNHLGQLSAWRRAMGFKSVF